MSNKSQKSKFLFKSILSFSALTIVGIAPLSVVSCQEFDDALTRPVNWYSPVNTKNGTPNAFANDPVSILFDEDQQLFYSWILFRNGKGFPSGWVEMTSPDLNKWTQGDYRIKLDEEFSTLTGKGNTSALGGSVWVDNNGDFFEKGDVVFVLSMQESKILIPNTADGPEIGSKSSIRASSSSGEQTTAESGIAFFVSHGLGQDFYTSGVLSKESMNKTPENNDWRDTFVFQTDDGVYFAISAHNRLEFWKINSFIDNENSDKPKIEKVSELFVRNIGVEVPNVVRLDQNLWYVSASVQDNPFGGPFQSSWWTLCTWDAKSGFTPVEIQPDGTYKVIENIRTVAAAQEIQKSQPDNKVIDWDISQYKDMVNPWIPNEYGTEGYAQRVVNPYQTQDNKNKKVKPDFLIARSMPSNWAYDTDIWSWKGGTYGSEKITFNDKWIPSMQPNDDIGDFVTNGTAVYELKGADLINGYNLIFNDKNFTFYLKDNQVNWTNDIKTGLKKWTSHGGPIDENDDIIIVWNRSTLTFYNKTKAWNAHFMLPEGTIHQINPNAKSIIGEPEDIIIAPDNV